MPVASPLFGSEIGTPGLIGNGGVFQDPAYWPVQRKLQLAQALMGEGLSSAPAYPMQALARIAQAGLGAFLEKRGEQALQDTMKQQGADALATYNNAMGGLGAALMPQAPSVAAPLPPAQQGASAAPAPNQYADIIQSAADRTGIPAPVLTAQIKQESNFDPNATGKAGEIGLMQIKPSTAQQPGFGMQGVDPATLRDPAANINFGADYLKARSGGADLSTPAGQAQALTAYNGGGDPNYVQHVGQYMPGGSIQVADAGNVKTDASAAPMQQPSGPDANGVYHLGSPTGAQTPIMQQALQMLDYANHIRLSNPYNPQMRAAADAIAQRAQLMLQTDRSETIQTPWGPGSHSLLTNEVKPYFTGTPRAVTDTHGNTWMLTPGGNATPLVTNPSGITGNTPEANAMRTIAEIGPKIANGTATPQERANYSTAAEFFQGFKTETNPADQSIIRVPQRALPPGMPNPEVPFNQPGGAPAHGGGETPNAQGVTKLTPGGAPQAAVDKRYENLHGLETTALGARDELQQAALLKQTMHELGSTGPATPFLANLSRYAAQAGVPEETIKKFGLPPGATEAQAAALANALVMEIARAGFPQRITNNDLTFASSIKPNPSQPLAAADFLIDNTIVPRAQRDIDRYGSVVNLTNPRHTDYDPNLGSMNSKLFDFDKEHPLSSYTPKLGGVNAAKPEAPAVQQSSTGAPQYREGQTATGPGGKRIIFKGGQWVPM